MRGKLIGDNQSQAGSILFNNSKAWFGRRFPHIGVGGERGGHKGGHKLSFGPVPLHNRLHVAAVHSTADASHAKDVRRAREPAGVVVSLSLFQSLFATFPRGRIYSKDVFTSPRGPSAAIQPSIFL